MSNIKFLETAEFLDSKIPGECFPQRFAIATNLLLCADDGIAQSLLLFNYEPEKWNQWYPYFSSYNGKYDFKGETYGDVRSDFNSSILCQSSTSERFASARNGFAELLGIAPDFEIVESTVKPEMWLKYSKTQNVWTFYYMEFYQVTKIKGFEKNVVDGDIVDLMPLTTDVIQQVIQTGQYKGIDVVDNTISLLQDQSVIDRLLERKIIIH